MKLETRVGAVVLAAGMSRRMGHPKQLLPWGKTTVIRQVVNVLQEGGLSQIVVVTGRAGDLVKLELEGTNAQCVYNPNYETSEMLTSLKLGIQTLDKTIHAALVVLGDQPQIEVSIVQKIIEQYTLGKGTLIVPSYKMRRGHPWLVDRKYWQEILLMNESQESLREFLNRHSQEIFYFVVDTPSVLADLDTPEDYQQMRPENY